MLYAYVRYIEDGKTEVVPKEYVKKFSKYNADADSAKLFKVLYSEDNQYYKANIISVGDTPEEALAQGSTKRFRIPNSKYLSEDTETTTEAEFDDNDTTSTQKRKENSKAQKAAFKENFSEMMKATEKDKITKKSEEVNILHKTKSRPSPDQMIQSDMEMESLIQKLEGMERELIKKDTELKKKNLQLVILTEELDDLKLLNRKMQETVINKFEDLIAQKSPKIEENNNNITPIDDGNSAVGIRRNDKVHLGKGVWLPSMMFDPIARRRKNTMFIKDLAMAVFGKDILINSSLCGGPANRIKKLGRPALDATKLLAMQDILRHRLRERGFSLEEENKWVADMDRIINEKIQDLRKPSRPKKDGRIQKDADETENPMIQDIVQLNDTALLNLVQETSLVKAIFQNEGIQIIESEVSN